MDFKNMTQEVAKEGFGCGIDCSMAVAAHCSHELDISEKAASFVIMRQPLML